MAVTDPNTSSASPVTSPRLGRPRRFEGDQERALLLDAAVEVMTGRDYADVTVADILSEAGLSTRAFYRHFESKEALLIALMRRDAEGVGRSLEQAVARAPDPEVAVSAWLDEYLAVFYEPRRASRTTLYASPSARASLVVTAEHAQLRQIVARSLVGTLREGHRSGALQSADPEADAMSILALVGAATVTPGRARTQDAALEQVKRYVWPALGLLPD